MAILDSLRTDGEWAYGMTLRSSSRASLRSCIRRRSRALMLKRTALPWRFLREPPVAGPEDGGIPAGPNPAMPTG